MGILGASEGQEFFIAVISLVKLLKSVHFVKTAISDPLEDRSAYESES